MNIEKAWLLVGYGFVGLVVYESLTTSPLDVGGFEGVKAGHVFAYAWLMLWFAQVYPATRARIAWAIGFVLMGAALEYLQLWVGYRSFAYADMRDNGIGVLIGGLLALTPLGSAVRRLR